MGFDYKTLSKSVLNSQFAQHQSPLNCCSKYVSTMDQLISTSTSTSTSSPSSSSSTSDSELDNDHHSSVKASSSNSISQVPTKNSVEMLVLNVFDELLFSESFAQNSSYKTATPISKDFTQKSHVYWSNSNDNCVDKDNIMVDNSISSTLSYSSSPSSFCTSLRRKKSNLYEDDNIDNIENVETSTVDRIEGNIDEILIVYPNSPLSNTSGLCEESNQIIVNHNESCDMLSAAKSDDHSLSMSLTLSPIQSQFIHSELSETSNSHEHASSVESHLREHSSTTTTNTTLPSSPKAFSFFTNSNSKNTLNSENRFQNKHLKSTPTLYSYDSALYSASTTPSPCLSPTSCPALSFYFNPVTFPLGDSEIQSDSSDFNSDCDKIIKNNKTFDRLQSFNSYLNPTNSDILSTKSASLSNCDVSSNNTINNSNSLLKNFSNNTNKSQSQNTLHNLPPSVVISDHSLDEVTVVHDYDLNHIPTKQTLNLMNPSNDLSNYLLSGSSIRRDSLASICSSTSSLSSLGEGDDFVCDGQSCCGEDGLSTPNLNTSPWRKIRSLVTSPFIQTYKRQKYPWIQLAGHQGNFMAGHSQGTILKKLSGNEKVCFEKLMEDIHLKEFVPEYKETITNATGEVYLELEDLLAQFTNPSIMDIKMGLRTYLEEELIKAGEKPKLRKDMYEKMVAIDPNEPKPEEHSLKAVTKPRYMIWRESISSTSTLGFRIDGVKLRSASENNNCSRMIKHDFKRTKTEDSVRTSIELFADKDQQILCKYYNCLKRIRESLINSKFFSEHEMIGSSLLFVHDDQNASIWLIDFAKTYPLPSDIKIDHLSPWTPGNHEDGYLVGLDNLIRIFGQLCDNVCQDNHSINGDVHSKDKQTLKSDNILQEMTVLENNSSSLNSSHDSNVNKYKNCQIDA